MRGSTTGNRGPHARRSLLFRGSTAPIGGLLRSGLALFVGATLALASAQDLEWGDESGAAELASTPRLFTLPEDEEATTLARSARELLGTQRSDRALPFLTRLTTDNRGVVLPPSFGDDGSVRTLYDRYLGAANWAEFQFDALSDEQLASYRRNVAEDSNAALEHALEQAGDDTRQRWQDLVEVTRSWPRTRAAARAWCAIGDLEFAAGRIALARVAFERALGATPDPDVPDAERTALAARLSQLDAIELRTNPDASLALPPPDAWPGPLPSSARDSWTTPLPNSPFQGQHNERFNLYPVLFGDRVFVSTSLELLCFDVFTGERLWASGEPEGWRGIRSKQRAEFFKAIDHDSTLIAPAAGSGVAVAALQVPFATLQNQDFQGLPITRSLPQRRLHAYDVESGAELWSHAPPIDWDGISSVEFAERYAVSGPPVVHDGRVIVPCVEMKGRVKLHVACYDLHDGSLLWQTPVVTGQLELNMFNRHEQEYSGAPVRVEGDTVIVTTQLGTIAALDVFDGAIRWQSLYEQIPLPGTSGYLTSDRARVWQNSAPLVAQSVVVTTPIDSEDLLGVSLEDGRVLWAYPSIALNPRRSSRGRVDALLGASEDTLFLGGEWLVSWQRPGGMASPQRFVPGGLALELRDELLGAASNPLLGPRGAVADGVVLQPGGQACLAFDPGTGLERAAASIAWSFQERGNLTVGRGVLLSTRSDRLTCFLDLSVLESHAVEQLARAPHNPAAALRLARLLNRRAEAALTDDGPNAALDLYARARTALEVVIDARDGDADPEILAELVDNLRSDARLAELTGDLDRALALLERSLAAAPTGDLRRDSLLDIERLARLNDPERWRATLQQLESEAASERIPKEQLLLDPRWLGFVALDSSATPNAVPVTLWTRVQRAMQAEREGDFETAVAEFQAALQSHADVNLASEVTAALRLEARIGSLLDLGGAELYAPFAEAAQLELETALAERDDAALRRIPDRYPFAPAADAARRVRLDRALEQGDLDALAQAANELLSELALRSGEASIGQEQAELLAKLAAGFGAAGNTELERELLAELAESWPDLEFVDGRSLAAASDAIDAAHGEPLPELEAARFDSSVRVRASLPGPYEILGRTRLGADADAAEGLLVWRAGRLEAYSAESPLEPRFTVEVELDPALETPSGRFAIHAGRCVLVAGGDLVCVDLAMGEIAWRYRANKSAGRVNARRIVLESGVVIAYGLEGRRNPTLFAIDAVHGIELWRQRLEDGPRWYGPLLDGARVVMFEQAFSRPLDVRTFDAFSGEARLAFEVPGDFDQRGAEGAFVQDGCLILASFDTSRVVSYRIHEGREAWTFDAGSDRDLNSLLRHGERLFAVTTSAVYGTSQRGALLEIEPRSGGRREIMPLEQGARLFGVALNSVVELPSPWLFAILSSDSQRTPLVAVDLSRGRRWKRELSLAANELGEPERVTPATSDTVAAIIYREREPRSDRGGQARIEFYSLENGIPKDRRLLPEQPFGEAFGLELATLGESLWLGCQSRSGREDRLEIWTRDER